MSKKSESRNIYKKNSDVAVIVPVYNEGSIIKTTILELEQCFNYIICVNDGSKDNTLSELRKTNCIIVNHRLNLGQGASIQSGIEYALLNSNKKYFITFDGDGQHVVDEAVSMLKHLQNNRLDIVLGSRFLHKKTNVPFYKTIILKIALLLSNKVIGLKLSDTHNGLRVFNRHVAETINLEVSGMAHATEIIYKIRDNVYNYSEFPTTINYTDYSVKKGQPIMNSINIVFDILMNRFSRKK